MVKQNPLEHPILSKIWNKELNKRDFNLELKDIRVSDNKTQIWVDCQHCGETHLRSPYNSTRYKCKNVHMNFIKHNEKLMKEWNYELNEGVDVNTITISCADEVWWTCQDCGEDWQTKVRNRRNSGCPYCAKIFINETNSFYTLSGVKDRINPKHIEISKTISCSNTKEKIGVFCGCCGVETVDTPMKLSLDTYCECGYSIITQKRLQHRTKQEQEQDYQASLFKNVYPELVERLVHPEQAEEKLHGNISYEFYCDCGGIIKKKAERMSSMTVVSCKKCTMKGSYPERFFRAFLMVNNIEYIQEKTFDWLPNKRYDFYIPSTNTIIEVHGLQHYDNTNEHFGKLKDIQANDKLKKETALANDINHYIVIDASSSSFKFLMNSTLNSTILNTLNIQKSDVNWVKIGEQSLIPPNILAVQCWNNGSKTIKQVAELVGISYETARVYLNKGAELGLCDYSKEDSYTSLSKKMGKEKIFCYDPLNNTMVKEFDSTREAHQWVLNEGLTKNNKETFRKQLKRVANQDKKIGSGYRTYLGFYWKTEKKVLAESV